MSGSSINPAAILAALPPKARVALRELPGGSHDAETLRALRDAGLIGPFCLADSLTGLGYALKPLNDGEGLS